MAHIHSVYDTDKHFTIEPSTRVLVNQTPEKASIMQYDHASERITFDLPAVVEGHRILDCNRVEVHYLNIDVKTQEQRAGLYEVTDLQLSPADQEVAICSWLISMNATQLVGPLYFRLTFKCVTEGNIDYSWSTAIYKGLSISDGINCTEYVADQYADILAQWMADTTAMAALAAHRVLEEAKSTGVFDAVDYDKNVQAIAHRGYSITAPENTIPAYILAKRKGFTYVECDVAFTSDNVAVLLHDSTIDRTSDGTGSISSMTYNQAAQYDYGSWKSVEYTGTTIPTFDEFIMLCKKIGLHPYIELKSNGVYTEEHIASIVKSVNKHGMKGEVTYISFNPTYLGYVKTADATAILGYVVELFTEAEIETIIAQANELKTEHNSVFMDVAHYTLTEELVTACLNNELPIEVWTVNDANTLRRMNPYVSGVSSDCLHAGKILYDDGMVFEPYVPFEPDADVSDNIPLTNGMIGGSADNNYRYNDSDSASKRVAYTGTGVPLTKGKTYHLIGVDGIRYSVITLTEAGLQKVLARQNISDNDKLDSGWQQSGYVFTAEESTCAWINASKQDGTSAIAPEEAMPVRLEETTLPEPEPEPEPDADVSDNIPLTQGMISKKAANNYRDSNPADNSIRVSYTGTGVPLTPGKEYRLIGVDGIRYAVQTLNESGLQKVLRGQDVNNADVVVDSGWQKNGYAFTAVENAACAWITASKQDGTSAIAPEEAMPVRLEEITHGQ